MNQISEFSLEGRPYIALNNLLKITGLCSSGGAAKTLVGNGRVTVNGRVELRKRCKILPGQVVEFEGQSITVIP